MTNVIFWVLAYSLLALCIVAAAWEVMQNRGRLRKKQGRFAQRERAPVAQIIARFYRDSDLDEAVVRELWLEVAHTLKIDAERLRPSDRFDREFAPVSGASAIDELDELACRLRDRCRKQRIPEIDPASLVTLDDYVRTVGRRISEHRGLPASGSGGMGA